MNNVVFKEQLTGWCNKVLSTEKNGMVDTYRMMKDIDKIIANYYDHAPLFAENE